MKKIFGTCFFLFPLMVIFAQNPTLVLPIGHVGDRVSDIAISGSKKFIATISMNEIKIWEYQSGLLLKTILGQTNGIYSIAFSEDEKQLVSTGFDLSNARFNVMTWDISTSNPSLIMSNDSISFYHAFFSAHDQKIICTSDTAVFVWDIPDKKIEKTIPLTRGKKTFPIYDETTFISLACPVMIWGIRDTSIISFNNVSSYFFTDQNHFFTNDVLVVNNYDTIFHFNLKKATPPSVLKIPHGSLRSLDLSEDGRYVALLLYPNILKIWDVGNNRIVLQEESVESCQLNSRLNGYLIKKINAVPEMRSWNGMVRPLLLNESKTPFYRKASCYFSNDYTSIFVNRIDANEQLTVDIWNSKTLALEHTLTGHTLPLDYAVFNKKGNRLITISTKDYSQIYDLEYGNVIGRFYIKNDDDFNDLSSPDTIIQGRQVVTAENGSYAVNIADTAYRTIYSIYPIDTSDCIITTPKGYYKATPNASKLLHYVTDDLKVITFEQLDVKYNRPDIILEAMGCPDTVLIRSYKKAYEKRIKKLGIDTSTFRDGYSVPEADFANRSTVKYEQTKGSFLVHITGVDSTYKLDRFNVWVNETPLFGQKGISIRKQNKNTLDTSFIITLSKGDNRIETSVLNVNGTESYRSPLFVKYLPTEPKKEKVHFIGIGINQFANADYNLSWSVKDIRDLVLKLKEHYGEAISMDTLFDENVTREKVLALKAHLFSLSEDDKVIVSYSGHGVLSKDLDYFLSTYNITFENPEENGLPYDDLESLMDGIRPRKKLMLIDACHSGEVDKDEIARIETVAQKLDSNGISHKSRINIVPKKKLGMSNSFELMQNLFVNVGKSTGATIISAAGGMQYAQERGDLKNGVFTYSILEAFNANNSLTVSQLKKIVGDRVTALTNGLQKPTSRNETINVDWNVW